MNKPVFLFSVLIILGSVLFDRSNGLIGNIYNEYGRGKFYSSEYENGSGTEDNDIVAFPGKLYLLLLIISGIMRAMGMGDHRQKIEQTLFLGFGAISLIMMYVLVLDTSSPYRTVVEDKNAGLILMTISILFGMLVIFSGVIRKWKNLESAR